MESEQKHHTSWRMVVAAILVVLFGILLGAANHAIWLGTTIVNTDAFVATFAPLPGDAAVAAALGAQIGDAVVEENDVEGKLQERLPEGIGFIAAPVTDAVAGLIANIAAEIISSDQFSTVWATILTGAHKTALFVLDGSDKVNASDGTISLDFSETMVLVQDKLEEAGFDIFDGDEEITASVVVYESDSLGTFQRLLDAMEAVRWIAPIAVLLSLIGAVAIATDRRKVTLWLSITTVVVMVLMLIEIRYLRSITVSSIDDTVLREGAEAAWAIILNRLLAQTWALLILGLLIGFAAWVMGPGPRAEALRERYKDQRDSLGSKGTSEPTAVTRFVSANKRGLQWGAAALGAVFLLWTPTLRPWVIIATVIVVVAIAGFIEYLSASTSQEPTKEHSDSSV